MDTNIKKLAQLIESAAAALSAARDIMKDITWDDFVSKNTQFKTEAHSLSPWGNNPDENVIEWVFNWEKMIDSEGFEHPVPVNYISKSKLVEWDWLKLTINEDWKFLYKQIRPKPRRHLVWTLTLDEGQYKVIADWKTFKVILAAVTYLRANVWDRVSIIVPEWNDDVTWAAVDAVVPS